MLESDDFNFKRRGARDIWQQDGASIHRSRSTIEYLEDDCDLGKWLIALGSTNSNFPSWPPNSPDLSPLDFAFWANLKQKIMLSDGGWPCNNQNRPAVNHQLLFRKIE